MHKFLRGLTGRLTETTSESGASESIEPSVYTLNDQTTQYLEHQFESRKNRQAEKFTAYSVKCALSEPNLCPLSACYADILVRKVSKARSRNEIVSSEVEPILRTNLLYFVLTRQICDSFMDNDPDEFDRQYSYDSLDHVQSTDDSLWKVLDAMIITERKAARKWGAAAIGGARKSKRHERMDHKSAWNVFWEHFRAEPAKTTEVHVADERAYLGGRIATQGVFPPVSVRIAQEWQGFCHRHELEGSPPNSSHSLFRQSWRSNGSAPGGSQQKDDIKTWGFAAGDPNAAMKNSKGFVVKQSRVQSGGTPGTPQHTAARSNSRQDSARSLSKRGKRSSKKDDPASKTPRMSTRVVPKLQLDQLPGHMPSKRSVLPEVELVRVAEFSRDEPEGPSPTSAVFSPKFRSWDDYKQREKIQQRDDIDKQTRDLVRAACACPQRGIAVPLREHRAAVEWRIGRGKHPGHDTRRPGALTERSRRIHLPAVVQKRGCETEREGLRSKLAVPPATFRRPWSREMRHLPPITTKPGAAPEKSAIQRYADIVQNAGIPPQPASINFLVHKPAKMDIRGKGYGDDDLLALVAALPLDSSLCVEVFDMGENPRLTDKSACLVLHALAGGSLGTLQGLYLDHCQQLFRESISLCTMLLSVTNRGEDLKELQVLDLSGIAIPSQEYVELARAVQMHMKLRDVRLADTGLGRYDKAHAGRVIGLLLQAAKLQALDLGWNMLDAAACHILGKGIVGNEQLKTLGLSSAASSYDAELGGSPLLAFFDFLSADYTLTKLDISHNALDHVAPLVLEYALGRHPEMEEIDISNNAIGVSGKRSLLRLLASVQCPNLSKIIFNGCQESGREEEGPFDGDPSACYTMKLSQPRYRAFLKLLLARCADGADAPPLPKLMRNAMYKLNGTQAPFNFKLLRRGDNNVWEVPTCGELSFELSATEMILGPESSWFTDIPVAARIEEMYTKSRKRIPEGRKTYSLLCQVKNSKDQVELHGVLQALSADFLLTPEQFQGLCTTKMKHAVIAHDLPGTLCKLLPCLCGMEDFRQVMHCCRTVYEVQAVHFQGYKLLALNLENPNGRYDLELSSPAEHAAAEKLLLLNRWELQVWKSSGRPDISQYGNGRCFRNTRLDDRKFVWSVEEWRLPCDELLSFDYASLRRPPENAKPLSDDKFQYMMRALREATSDGALEKLTKRTMLDDDGRRTCGYLGDYGNSPPSGANSFSRSRTASAASSRRSSVTQSMFVGGGTHAALLGELEADPDEDDEDSEDARRQAAILKAKRKIREPDRMGDDLILRAIRAVTPHFYINCRQCRECLCIFTEQQARTDVLVYLCPRVVDWPMNANLVHSKIDNDRWKDLTERVGYIYCFPFFQPENYTDTLDLSVNEQRRVLHFLVSLMVAERHNNIIKPRVDWAGPSSSPDWNYFPNGLPLSWADFDHVPEQGFFECSYVCSGDDAKLKVRRRLAASVGGFTAMPEDQVELENSLKFWAVLGGVPQEVHTYLYFIVITFDNLRTAFSRIDTNGDGELSLKEFVEGNRKCGFRLPPDDDCPEEPASARLRRASTRDLRRQSTVKDRRKSEVESPDQKRKGSVSPTSPERIQRSLAKENERVDANLRAVYRFLDPNKDGSVSMREFFALEGMWRELKQNMWEFVDHCRSKFGSLDKAWDAADEDGSSSLDAVEFEQLARNWQFDGPVAQLYMWLDQNGSNSVSRSEWLTLEKIEKPNW